MPRPPGVRPPRASFCNPLRHSALQMMTRHATSRLGSDTAPFSAPRQCRTVAPVTPTDDRARHGTPCEAEAPKGRSPMGRRLSRRRRRKRNLVGSRDPDYHDRLETSPHSGNPTSQAEPHSRVYSGSTSGSPKFTGRSHPSSLAGAISRENTIQFRLATWDRASPSRPPSRPPNSGPRKRRVVNALFSGIKVRTRALGLSASIVV
jgi:hypothetical protein